MNVKFDRRQRILVDIVVKSQFKKLPGQPIEQYQPYLEIFILTPNGSPPKMANQCICRIGAGKDANHGLDNMEHALAFSERIIADTDIQNSLLTVIADWCEQLDV